MVVYVFELARSRTHGQAPAVGVRFAARYRGAGHFPGRIGAGRRLLAQRGNRRGLRQPVVTRAVCERCVSTAHVVGRQHQHAATSCCTVRLHGQPDCHGNSSKTRLQQHSPQVMPTAVGNRLSSLFFALFCARIFYVGYAGPSSSTASGLSDLVFDTPKHSDEEGAAAGRSGDLDGRRGPGFCGPCRSAFEVRLTTLVSSPWQELLAEASGSTALMQTGPRSSPDPR